MTARINVEGSGEYDPADDEYALPDVIWYLVGHREGRWLFVDHASPDGIPVGIQMAYTKYLDPHEARAMAQALLEAADEQDALNAEQEAKRQRLAEAVQRCKELGGHEWPDVINWSTDWICTRRGSAPETVAVRYDATP